MTTVDNRFSLITNSESEDEIESIDYPNLTGNKISVENSSENSSETLPSSLSPTNETLNSEWRMLYRDQNTKKQANNNSEDFTSDMIDIVTCNTVLSFWQMLNAIPFPSKLKSRTNSSYMFFRKGIQPTWEDKANQNGGMWRIVIKKHEDRSKYLDTFWLELLMALVGEQFQHSMDITGCVVKRRQKEDRIELWTKGYGDDVEKDQLVQTNIGEHLRQILGLDDELEYTKHDAVKKMEVVRNAGNRAYGGGYGGSNVGNYGKVAVREHSRNRVETGGSRKGSIIRNVSMSNVFDPEYKNRSFEYRTEDRGKFRT